MQIERITFSLKDRVPIAEKTVGIKNGDRVRVTVEATVAEVGEESFDGVVADVISFEPLSTNPTNAITEVEPVGPASVVYPA